MAPRRRGAAARGVADRRIRALLRVAQDVDSGRIAFNVAANAEPLLSRPSGELRVIATGFSKVLVLAFDERARLYVLEASYSTTDPGPEPGTGRLIRVLPDGRQEVLIDSTSGLLTFPTGMTFGPDGALYISNVGFGPPPIGPGQIVRVQFQDDDR